MESNGERSSELDKCVDAYVGERMRRRRAYLGMTMSQLSDRLNLTYQQIQKYEKGSSRISASRLFMISKLLDVDVSYFYEGVETYIKDEMESEVGSKKTVKSKANNRLEKAYAQLENPEVRDALMTLLNSFSTDSKNKN